MIKSLKLTDFVKHKNRTIEFKDGLTAVQGKNGAGKTLIQEAISFALFGSTALRGKVEEYDKTLKVELCIEIRDVPFDIKRTLKDCTISTAGEQLVCGNVESTKFVEKLLGYGQNVFNFANLAKQGEITAFGDSTPSERKAAVDSLMGLNSLDKLLKTKHKRVIELKSEMKGLQTGQVATPIAPTKPDGDPEVAKALIANKRDIEQSIEIKETLIKHLLEVKTKIVEAPSEAVIKAAAEDINVITDEIAKTVNNLNELNEIVKNERANLIEFKEEPKDSAYLAHQMELNEKYVKLPTCAKPTLTGDEIELYLDDNARYELYKMALENGETETCPKCHHEFVPNLPEAVEKPKYDRKTLNDESSRLKIWSERVYPDVQPEEPEMTPREIERATIYAKRRESVKLMSEDELRDIESKIDELNAFKDSLVSHFNSIELAVTKVEAYESYLKTVEEKQRQLTELEAELTTLNEKNATVFGDNDERFYKKIVKDHDDYNFCIRLYASQKEQFDKTERLIAEVKDEIAKLTTIEDVIKDTKQHIKTQFVPTLTKIANQIVTEMSQGELTSFSIGDDFDISLDGRRLVTFSGSEKVLANLALRIALGRVLTRGVLSTIWLDEPDAACSQERSNDVLLVLRELTNHLKQVIVVSHREVDSANNYIDL